MQAELLQTFLDYTSPLDVLFSSFRPRYGAEMALVTLVDDLHLQRNKDKASLLFLNLSVAFDTVNHCILLHHLESGVKVKGTMLPQFRSFLSDCSQKVVPKVIMPLYRFIMCPHLEY